MLTGDMLKAAASLAEVYKTLSPKPLVTREELDAFYSSQLNAVRGEDHGDRLGPCAGIPDAVLYSLLRPRAVQELSAKG